MSFNTLNNDIPNPVVILELIEKLIELYDYCYPEEIITQEIEMQDLNPVQIEVEGSSVSDWIFVNKYKKRK